VKNLIVINDSKTPFSELKNALKPYQKKYQVGKAKNLLFEASGLIALVYPDVPISGQLELLNKIKCTWPKLMVIFAGEEPIASEVILLSREGLTDYLISPINIKEMMATVQRIQNEQAGMKFNPLNFNLTEREFEVCKLLVKGLKSKDAADYLQITPATIKVHKSRIMRKLKVGNLPDLVRVVAT
jgi:DNA-binding NarL/FixJ family response regulator